MFVYFRAMTRGVFTNLTPMCHFFLSISPSLSVDTFQVSLSPSSLDEVVYVTVYFDRNSSLMRLQLW